MRRALLQLAGPVATVPFMWCLLMWLRSYAAEDSFYFAPTDVQTPLGLTQKQWSVSSAAGRLQVARREIGGGSELPRGLVTDRRARVEALPPRRALLSDRAWEFAGVEYFRRLDHHQQVANGSYLFWGFACVRVPYWMLSVATAAAAAVWIAHPLRRWRNARRRRLGLCPKCGYDLRETPERCPECGMGAAAQKA